MPFPSISPKQSFPALESEILAYWKANDTFKKSIESRPMDNPYRFYDGPPFITGTPHYGSLLSSVVKDVVGRYWTMQGRRVDRIWGWDCHGLPIEEKVQKKLGLKSNKEIEENGVKNFIDECYKYTTDVSSEWDWYIDKIGRWVDMDGAYRTMDQDYMESVIWVFSELWKKGLVYEGKRVSLYSWKLGTPISNFEVAMDDTYQEVNDPAITVKFALEQDTDYIDTKEGGIFEYTPDGFLRYVLAVIKNEKGEFLMFKNIKHNHRWQCPGGKIDKGETAEIGLKREVMEELGVECTIGTKVAEKKTLVNGTKWQGEYYEIVLEGIPSIQEAHKHSKLEWVSLIPGESGYILQAETERSEDQIYIQNNFDLWNLASGKRPDIANISILAWTTTPWTIPANMALAVRRDIDYVLVENNGEGYIVAHNRVENVFKGKGAYTIIREFKGSELVGLSYVPPFPEYYYQNNNEKNHKIYHADFITDTDGTGIGHQAPEFGEVDFQLAKKEGITITEAMDEAGKYTSEIFDYEGTHYLDLDTPENGANKINIERMKTNNTLFKLEGITHRIPFCPRSGTPLVQKAQASWFIDIQSQKDKLIEANEQINWFPEYLKEGRFKKGIETAPDWCISRTRYWGAPMPVWIGKDGKKIVVSSRDEIFEANKPYKQLTKLIFVRHGRTDYNGKKVDVIGKAKLIDEGYIHAENIKKSLGETPIDKIYSSPFQRCIDTINPLAKSKKLGVIIDDRLKELQILSSQEKETSDINRKAFSYSKIEKDDENIEIFLNRTQEFLRQIVSENPGKTIVICSHFFTSAALQKCLHNFDWDTDHRKYALGNTIESKGYTPCKQELIFSDTCTAFNLHKPYIDSIFLKNPKYNKTKKILGIHGFRRSKNVIDFFEQTAKNIQEKGFEISCPIFEIGESVNYENWKKIFFENIEGVDTIFAHSLGCRFSLDMIIENQISIKKLILIAPPEGKHEKLQEFFNHLQQDICQIKKYVDKVVILYSTDDKEGRVEASENLIEKTGGFAIKVNGYGHFNLTECQLIEDIIRGIPQEKTKKVLGIHGCSSDIQRDNWKRRREVIESNNMSLDLFQFDRSEDPTYESWKTVFDSIDFSEYDVVYASSLGGVMTTRYLAENNICVPRIIMVAPGISNPVINGLKPNVKSIYESIDNLNIQNIANEMIVLHAKDDEEVPYANGKEFAEKIGAQFIGIETGNHNFKGQYQLIAGILQYGSPLTRIPEVLDVWMDSGSMPYAQMHYPFENTEAMQASFPADFIAEYVGQIRAWFYVMHVLGVLLNPNNEPKPTPSFTNVITTGVINGNDGRKMSKSFQNYPDPRMAIEKYGADPIRFYMLNSPLLSGGDMDFKEEGIIETIKGVMLPIWNTYSFFTTYANIDNWEADTTEIWFARHAESTSNVISKMSDGSDNPELTENGREQAKNAGKTLRDQGKNFDIIVHTDRIRTSDTAHIIGDELGFSGEYITNDGFAEQTVGEYANKTLTEIAEMHNADPTDHATLRKHYKNNSVENIKQFEIRILKTYAEILTKYKGKNILIVAHAGTPRPILHKYMGMDMEQAYYNTKVVNAAPFRLMSAPIANPLDSWILSKLQVLIGQVHDAMEGYDISRGCRTIVEYMDELTNWYVRLSRRRFWESGMTTDKQSAYQTLHMVLTELSKLMAPLMPFLSESIYRGLTGRESVHLDYITRPNTHLIANDLNRDMEVCEHIVSLGLALRSHKNIRVRQPLESVTITKLLSPYYQAIIRDELNVKNIIICEAKKIAKEIAKPDAKKIGPKYGKDVQIIIKNAKEGNFNHLVSGIIEVWDSTLPEKTFTLEQGEYNIEYIPLEGFGDVTGGYGMVVALDTMITESLKLEGYARDTIRLIQDMRKEADYAVTDRINLSITGEGSDMIINQFGELISNETLSTFTTISTPDIEKNETIDENINITLKIAKK